MRMTQAERIIKKFGTQEALATALGCRQSVIAGWKRRGFVPAQQQERVLAAAREVGIRLRPADFFASPSVLRRTSSTREAAA
jgi:ribosome-binding protein aMBF1 (putative translation factor)